MEKVRLNLGSGDIPIVGYVNIDRKNGQEAYPLDIEDASVDEIRASHILEHFGLAETGDVIKCWASKLKPGGILKIAVPDFAKIVEGYKEGEKHTVGYCCGGQTDENDFHKAIFDKQSLTSLLDKAGLIDITHWDSEVKDCASLPVSLNLQCCKPGGNPELQGILNGFAARKNNVYSQYGEDGIIEAIFESIGTHNKWCLEVGASDGVLFSNTRRLVEQGWSAILIESEKFAYERLVKNCEKYPNVQPVFGKIGVDCTLDSVLAKYDAPKDIDLMVVDIDGQDYHVINAMMNYNPRVLVAEFAPDVDTEYIPTINGPGQAGKTALLRLGTSKGYSAIVETDVNLIMIRDGVDFRSNETDNDKTDQGTDIETTVSTKIGAVMSGPRLGFSNNLMIAMKVFAPLGIDFEIGYGVFWSQVLTRLIENQIAKGMEWIAVLDYDSYYEQEQFLALCQVMAEHPEADAVFPIQIKRENDTILAGSGTHDTESRKFNADTDIIAVDSGHFGMTLFRAASFARLKKPWFLAVPAADGSWGDGRVDDDIYFWKNWRESGNKTFLSPRVMIGHMQLMVTWPGPLEEESKPHHQYLNSVAADGIPEWCKVSPDNIPRCVNREANL